MNEWRAIGSGLKELHEGLVKMSVLVGKHGYLKYGDRIGKLSERLVQIRSDLENEMFREYRSADVSIFFERKEGS
jgi:hypothetical protein